MNSQRLGLSFIVSETPSGMRFQELGILEELENQGNVEWENSSPFLISLTYFVVDISPIHFYYLLST